MSPLFGSVSTGTPGALVVPLTDGVGSPDRLAADAPVGFRHLAAGDVGADGGGRYVELARDVAAQLAETEATTIYSLVS